MRQPLIFLSAVLAAHAFPLLDKRQISGFFGLRQPQVGATEQQQESQTLARLNVQQLSGNVYRVQPTDQLAFTYGSALIILMPKDQTANIGSDIAKIGQTIPDLLNQNTRPQSQSGQSSVGRIAPSVTSTAQGMQSPPQASLQQLNSGQARTTYSTNAVTAKTPEAGIAIPQVQSGHDTTVASLAGGTPRRVDPADVTLNLPNGTSSVSEESAPTAAKPANSNTKPGTIAASSSQTLQNGARGKAINSDEIAEGKNARGASQVSQALTAAATF